MELKITMSIKDTITGVIVTIVIGGTTFAVSQTDIANNFAEETGMSQQEAEEYVSNVKDEDLVPFGDIGADLVKEGNSLTVTANGIDCVNYTYDWESPTLPCLEGIQQLKRLAKGEIALGESYKRLDSDSATTSDMSATIVHLDNSTKNHDLEIVAWMYDQSTITEVQQTNAYNKSLLKAALESN